MTSSYLKNIAIVGAGGQFGKFITKALLDQGKHTLTAISRANSSKSAPAGMHAVKIVDYDIHSSLVSALQGQDALIITLGVTAKDAQTKLIAAAKDAGVQWIMPNEYGVDAAFNESVGNDTRLGPAQVKIRQEIEQAGLYWVGLSCGFWYEFSLAGTEIRYGFDFSKKSLTLFDDGNTKIVTSTWPHAGAAVAKIFALPATSLETFINRAVYVKSFHISQREMLASVLRVTGDKESDWTITYEDSRARYERGCKLVAGGDYSGFGMLLYTRIFYPDGSADFAAKSNNSDLGLPEEGDLDAATKVAVEMAKSSQGWMTQW